MSNSALDALTKLPRHVRVLSTNGIDENTVRVDKTDADVDEDTKSSYSKEYYANNRERILGHKRKWALKNKDHIAEYHRNYYLLHKEERAQYGKQYYERKKEKEKSK